VSSKLYVQVERILARLAGTVAKWSKRRGYSLGAFCAVCLYAYVMYPWEPLVDILREKSLLTAFDIDLQDVDLVPRAHCKQCGHIPCRGTGGLAETSRTHLCGPLTTIAECAAREDELTTGMPHSTFNYLNPLSVCRQATLADFQISWVGLDGQNERSREQAQENGTGIADVSAEIQDQSGRVVYIRSPEIQSAVDEDILEQIDVTTPFHADEDRVM